PRGWPAGPSLVARLLDDAAGLPVPGVASGLARVVVGTAMDHQRPATNGRVTLVETDHVIEYLRPQCAVGADVLVRHVASMWSLGRLVAMLCFRRIEMAPGRHVAARVIA